MTGAEREVMQEVQGESVGSDNEASRERRPAILASSDPGSADRRRSYT
jgi:hypothetical protein